MAAKQAAKASWGATALPWRPGHGQHEFNEGLTTPTVNSDMKWQGDVLIDSVASWSGSARMTAMAQAKVVAMPSGKKAAMAQAKIAAIALGRN